MITCNNCGTVNPSSVSNCQNCMALLPTPTSKGENGTGSRGGSGSQDQPVLPAWLESLRAGDRPAVEPKKFSPEDMREEGMIPSWMQPNRSQNEQNLQAFPSMRSASTPAPNTDETIIQERNISAHSLIDENALPSWMQPELPPQQNISASSLIQPEFMPEWMRSMQPSSSQPSSPLPQQRPETPPPFSGQNFSAQDLIDPQALPGWMQQAGGQEGQSGGRQEGQGGQPFASSAPVQQPQSGPQSGNNQAGFSASSLLDMNALPSWMREGESNGQGVSGSQQPQQQQPWQMPQQQVRPNYEQPQAFQQQNQQYLQGQQGQQPSIPTSNASNQSQGGTLSMGSLIDVNALPEWLRSSTDNTQSQQGQMGQQDNRFANLSPSPGYAVPSRAENIRVPNRPRGENGVNEGSEVAANVFSSMLGVASSSPQYPTVPQQQPGQPTFPTGTATGTPSMPFNQGQVNQGYPTSQPPYSQNGPNYAMQYGQGQGQGARQVRQQSQNMNQPPAQGEKPTKKVGLFEAIRNFFFR